VVEYNLWSSSFDVSRQHKCALKPLIHFLLISPTYHSLPLAAYSISIKSASLLFMFEKDPQSCSDKSRKCGAFFASFFPNALSEYQDRLLPTTAILQRCCSLLTQSAVTLSLARSFAHCRLACLLLACSRDASFTSFRC
jgi:hypothetical protein